MFVPAALVALGVVYLLFRAQDDGARAVTAATQEKIVEIGAQRVATLLQTVSSDIRVLAGQRGLARLLASDTAEARQDLAAEYLNFIVHKPVYDQVRFLNLEGQEVVRVDRSSGAARIVPDGELQNQARSYYVEATRRLGPAEVYVSPMDLDPERGGIDRPIRPTLRFGIAVFDDAGRKRGLILLNYQAQRLLERVRGFATPGSRRPWLLNADGNWLLGPMHPDRQDRSFATQYPEAWERIRAAVGLGRMEIAGGMLAHQRVSLASAVDGIRAGETRPLFLISYLPAEAIDQLAAPALRSLAYATVMLMALLAVGSWLVARHWAARMTGEETLRRSEIRFRNLLESAPDAVVVTDADGRIVLANARAETLFGYSRQELNGEPIEILVPERYRGNHVGFRGSYMAEPRARPMGAGLELYGRRRDGKEFPVEVSLSPSRTAEGVLVFCDIRDVTGQRAIERQIQEMNERLTRDNAELEALNKELETFSYSVSHDLRAPLRAIDGFSQALVEDCADQLDATGRGYLGRIRNAAQRMGLLIDDLLKLARVTRAEVTFDDVDLGALAREVMRELQSGQADRRAEIVIAEGMRVLGDPRLLRIALENLLANAWKFTAGQDVARIEVGTIRDDGAPTYFVRDNGVGFDMAHAGRLFGAFQRLHHESEFAGTGVGLATVQRIVRRHGGRIGAEAAPGKGATFYFTIRTEESA